MTTGQRIAQKRKEQGLSQEALGELLSVSRQSIYKWESDAALPEIDKLVALSRLFDVTVGSLLGVEEPQPHRDDPEAAQAEPQNVASPELTEAQLQMVEEIVRRYLAAQPQPTSLPRKRRRLLKCSLAVAGVCLAMGLSSMSSQLSQLDSRYQTLQQSVSGLSVSVNQQIHNVSGQVEQILKAQNSLTADYHAELIHVGLASDTALFSVYAIPKTYVEGMQVEFVADNGSGGSNRAPGELGFNQKFSATLASNLTDSITLSAVFIWPDGTRQTQLLDVWEGLYQASLVRVDVTDHAWAMNAPVKNDSLALEPLYIVVREEDAKSLPNLEGAEAARIDSIRVGLFKNHQLVAWLSPCSKPAAYANMNEEETRFFHLPATTLPFGKEDELAFVALYTDQFGRKAATQAPPYVLDRDETTLTWADSSTLSSSPADWQYES